MEKLRVAVFDYGGVITTAVNRSVMAWLADEGIEVDGYRTTMAEWVFAETADGTPAHRLETGELSGPEFERLLAARLRRTDGGPVVAEGLLERMFEGMTLDDAMVQLVRDLRAAGLRTAMLSNSWANHYPEDLVAELFDLSVISGEVGLRKPDSAIFQLLLERLDTPAATVAFVDDIAHNVEGAAKLGISAVLHTDAASTRDWFAERVPALATGLR
ncbi:HAD family hydrolase [Fodinicola acaciae]|uniref:HAD family hydrolase n=1 Tax=Fodinicola acaciae TaxID=2681555 RepID=UPI0013CF73AE|nr:HAD family phosphatase [Fodinicola acaciae]